MKIAFYKGRARVFNRFVSWWTNGPYSHCEAVFELGNGLAGPVLCWSSSWMDGGVRWKVMQLDPEHWDIIDVPAFDDARALWWFGEHKDDEYDLLGLLSTSLPIRHAKRRWFCSEAIATAVGMQEGWRFDPNGLARICEMAGGVWIQGGPENAANDDVWAVRTRVARGY